MDLKVRIGDGHRVRLWLPLFLLWLLALPLPILLLPSCLVFCVVARVDPLRWIATLWTLLSAAAGTRMEVDTPGAFVFMHIY